MSLNEATDFIDMLTGDPATPVCVRLIDDDRTRKLPAVKLLGAIEALWPQIEAKQHEGFGAFIVVNGGGNTDDEITDIRALFIDLDDKPLPETWHEPPDIIVSRDDKHHHVYWLTDLDVPVTAFSRVQRQLAQHYGGDETVCNPSRLLRLPGTRHQKDPARIKSYRIAATPWHGDYRLVDRLTKDLPPVVEKRRDSKPTLVDGLDLPQNVRRARAYLIVRKPAIGTLPDDPECANDHTYQTAQALRDLGISELTALDLMLEEWNERCEPPWRLDELAVIIHNAWAYGQNEEGAQAFDFDPLTRFADYRPLQVATEDDPYRPWKPSELLLRPPPQFYFPGIIPTESLGALIAPSDSGKSFFALHCGLTLATGIEGMGREAGPPRNVLYIPMEGSRDISHNRLPAWRQKHDVSQELVDHLRIVENFPDVLDGERVGRLLQRQRDAGLDVDLLLVDTYGRAMGEADLDENKAAEVRRFVRQMERIKRLMGCTVILIHHTAKDKSNSSAGSYALQADCDFWMSVETSWEVRAMAVSCGKMKGAARFDPLYFDVQNSGSSLALSGILPNEYKALTQVDDAFSPRVVQAALAKAKAYGEAAAITAHILASYLYVAGVGEPELEVQAKLDRIARKLGALGKGRYEHLVSAKGWFLPE